METSGRPTEGWMTIVPVTVLVLFVMIALGGPTSLVNILANWAGDVFHYVGQWIKYL
jgi:hypothetical protein